MDHKNRVLALVDLYKQQMERFHQTQQYEWKVNFGVWTLPAGAIYLGAQQKIAVSPWLAWSAAVAFVVIHGAWLSRIHASLRFDKKFWVRYRREALLLLRWSQSP